MLSLELAQLLLCRHLLEGLLELLVEGLRCLCDGLVCAVDCVRVGLDADLGRLDARLHLHERDDVLPEVEAFLRLCGRLLEGRERCYSVLQRVVLKDVEAATEVCEVLGCNHGHAVAGSAARLAGDGRILAVQTLHNRVQYLLEIPRGNQVAPWNISVQLLVHKRACCVSHPLCRLCVCV